MKLRKGVSWDALVVVKMKSMKVILFFLLILLTRLYARPLHYPHFKLRATYEPPTALPSIPEIKTISSPLPNLNFWPTTRRELFRKISLKNSIGQPNLNSSTSCQPTSTSPTPSHQESSTTHTPLISSTCSSPVSSHHTTTVVRTVTSRPSTPHTHIPSPSTYLSSQSSRHTSTVKTDESSTHTVMLQQSTSRTNTITPTTHIPSLSTGSPHSIHYASTVKTDKSSMHTVASPSACHTNANTSMTHKLSSTSLSLRTSHLTTTTKTDRSSTHTTLCPQTPHHTTAGKAKQPSTHTVTSETLKNNTLTTHLLVLPPSSLPHSSCSSSTVNSHTATSQRLTTHTPMTTSTVMINQTNHTVSTKYSSPGAIPTTTSTHRSTESYSRSSLSTITKLSTDTSTTSERVTTSFLKQATVLGTTTNQTPSTTLSTSPSTTNTWSTKKWTTFPPTTQSSKFESSTSLSTASTPSMSTSPCTSLTFLTTTITSATFTPSTCATREISTSVTSILSTKSSPSTSLATSTSELTTVASYSPPLAPTETSESAEEEENTLFENCDSTTTSTEKRHGDVYNLMIVFPLSAVPETTTSFPHPAIEPNKFKSLTSLVSYTSTQPTPPILWDTNEIPRSTQFESDDYTTFTLSRIPDSKQTASKLRIPHTTRKVCKHTSQRSLIFNKLFANPYTSFAIHSNSTTTKKQNDSSPVDFVLRPMNLLVMSLSQKCDHLEHEPTSCITMKSTISYSCVLLDGSKISSVRKNKHTSAHARKFPSTEPLRSSTLHMNLTHSEAPPWATTPFSADVRRFWPMKWNGLETMLTPGKEISSVPIGPTITLKDIWNLENLKLQLSTEEQPSSSPDEDYVDESSVESSTPQILDVTSQRAEEQLPRLPNFPALMSHFFGGSIESNTSDTVELVTPESTDFETSSDEITPQDFPSTDVLSDPDLIYEDIT